MRLLNRFMWAISCICFSQSISAQDNPAITFNKVKPEDFLQSRITVDTSFGAVIVADIGKSSFEGNSSGWFSLIYQHKRRIYVIDKKGFDLATISIPLYKDRASNKEETLESLKASTYNLENGKVVEIKLDKETVFKEKVDASHIIRKFTMPAVKEGSIIEYSYTVKSDFLFNLQPWRFQGAYPRMWSEYEVSIPAFFKYVFLSQGYFPFHVKKDRDVNTTYMVRESAAAGERSELYSIPTQNKISRWVIKDIPAMKEESFTSSVENHISKIDFQLAAYAFPNSPYKNIMGDWATVTKELMEDKDFGADLNNANNWIESDLKNVTSATTSKMEEAKQIYKHIQKTITNKGTRGIYLTQSLKDTYKNKNGHVADINMLLTLALKNRGFEASPVILSTRAHGFTNEIYPLLGKYNYVVSKVMIDGTPYFLDASDPSVGFSRLPSYCYNGYAQTITPYASKGELLLADTVTEMKLTQVFVINDKDDNKKMKGSLTSTLGYDESSRYRTEILESGKTAFSKKITDAYNGDIAAKDVEVVSYEISEMPMQVKYNLEMENKTSDLIYFNPMIREGMNTNVFKSATRQYPIEMPYKIYETYILKFEIPEGYVIDEMPKSVRSNYNDGEAMFEYIIAKSTTEINMRSVIKFEKATFSSEDYESLRSFFDLIVKKHAEQIVFKKK